MADDNQPELDAETLRKIEEEVQAQFAEHEPVLDEETLKQIEAQVNAEFEQPEPEVDIFTAETQIPEVAATEYEQPQIYEQPQVTETSQPPQQTYAPVQAQPAAFDPNSTTPEEPVLAPNLHQQPTDLDMSVDHNAPVAQFEQPQIQVQPMAVQQPAYQEPQPAYQEPAPAAYEEPQPVYQEPQPAYQEPAPVAAPKKTGGPKKKKLKGGGKTRVNMGGKNRPRSTTKAELEEEPEVEETPRGTRKAGRRTGRRKVEEEPKKGKTGLIIGIVAGVLIAIAVVVVIAMKGNGDKATDQEVAQEPETPVVEEKEEPKKPKEKSFATGAWNTQDFRTMVLKLITNNELEDAEIYIKSRKKDAPDEDLSYLEKRLKRAKGE